ncbi:MAG: ATP-binding protein [Ignavibacteriales bacterium]
MPKFKIISLVILITLLSFSAITAQQTAETKTILILFGLSPSQPAYHPILDGIRKNLIEEYGYEYNLHLEYLESENQPGSELIKETIHIYNEKYRSINLDLLICVGRNIIIPLKENAESYLLNLPTISIDFDFSDYGINSDLKLNDQTEVIALKFNIGKMIPSALSIFPHTTSIYFIGGTTIFDKFMLSLVNDVNGGLSKNQKISFLTDLSMDEIIQKVHNLPESSLIFVPSFNTDAKSVTYYNPEAIKLISSSANAPIFAYTDMGLGDGSVGGYILSFKKVGLLAGEYAVKILNGAKPNSMLVKEEDYYEYIFDWRQLKRWNIAGSDLIPKGSTILFKQVNLLEEYKWVFGLAVLFLVLQSFLIATLIRLNRSQKLMTKKIIETESRYRDFLHEDRILRLGQLAASLSHELNQPLTAILSTAQAGINFINSNEASPELLKQILQKIVENDKRTASILGSIRGMLKLENRKKEKINLNGCVTELIEVYKSEAIKKNTKIDIKLIDSPVYIIADKIQIQQVLLNLITNATQVMEKQKTENCMIDILQTVENGNVIISVRDYGKGVDESIKDRIFKPFITSRVEGSGIGLSICKSIIEDHNGKIWAENLPDGGAKFSFSLNILKHE